MSTQDKTLFKEIPVKFQDDRSSLVVRTAMKIVTDSKSINDTELDELDDIADLYDETFDVEQPEGTMRTAGEVLFQVVEGFVTRMKQIDVQLMNTTIEERMRQVDSQGVAWVLKQGGYVQMLRDNFGGFKKQLIYGDFFAMVGQDKKGLPEFMPVSSANVYFDASATSLRANYGNGKTIRAVVTFEYTWDEAILQFPELEKKGSKGKLPDTNDSQRFEALSDKDYEQDDLARERMVEIGYYYDISESPNFTIMAGKGATILQELKGDDYPFFLNTGDDRENYIPLLQWSTYPTQEGMLNAGIGHVIYRLTILFRQFGNKAINYVMDNIDPIRVLNLPKQQAPGFLKRLKDAQLAQSKGMKGVVINAFGEGEKQSGTGNMDTMQSQPLSGEMNEIFNFLNIKLQRYGYNLDRIVTDPNKPFRTVLLEEENSNEVIDQFHEVNGSTYEFVYKIAMDYIKKNIKEDDETPLPFNLIPDDELEEAQPEDREKGVFTLGMLAENLNYADTRGGYQTIPNIRTGRVNSGTLDRFFLQSAVNDLSAIGDSEQAIDLLVQKHRLNGVNLKKKKAAPAPEAPEAPGAAVEPGAPPLFEGQEDEVLFQ